MKYGKEITDEICKYLHGGSSNRDTAALVGISEDTFYAWQKEHSEFSEAIKKAEQICKARNIAYIQRAAETTWQAAAWWLERKYHNEFALKTVMEHTSDEDKPLIIKIVSEKQMDERIRTTHQELPETAVNL